MELIGYYTDLGRQLSLKLLSGTALHITRAAAGNGVTPLSADRMAAENQALPISPMRRVGSTVMLPVTLAAALAEAPYTVKEVGIYAQDGSHEILYRLYRLQQPLEISPGQDLTIRFELRETVSESTDVTADSSAGLLTEAELGIPGGVAALDETGVVPVSQLPYTWGTEDISAGSASTAPTGSLHFVYE